MRYLVALCTVLVSLSGCGQFGASTINVAPT